MSKVLFPMSKVLFPMSKVLSLFFFSNKKYQIQTFLVFKLVFYPKMDIIEICPFGCPFGFCDMVEKGCFLKNFLQNCKKFLQYDLVEKYFFLCPKYFFLCPKYFFLCPKYFLYFSFQIKNIKSKLFWFSN